MVSTMQLNSFVIEKACSASEWSESKLIELCDDDVVDDVDRDN